jgi:hypothetical protein
MVQTANFVQYQSQAQPRPTSFDFVMTYFEAANDEL